jgi:hypothetical protein
VTFVRRTVAKGESISFGFDIKRRLTEFNFAFNNLKEVSIIVSNSDPDQGGTTIINETLSTSYTGPYTIGSTIASGFILNGFPNYKKDDDTGLFSLGLINIKANGGFFGFEATAGWVR